MGTRNYYSENKGSQSVPECPGVFQSVLECPGVSWSVLECPGVFQSVLECPVVFHRVQLCPRELFLNNHNEDDYIYISPCRVLRLNVIRSSCYLPWHCQTYFNYNHYLLCFRSCNVIAASAFVTMTLVLSLEALSIQSYLGRNFNHFPAFNLKSKTVDQNRILTNNVGSI
jgi:hypothetical protein